MRLLVILAILVLVAFLAFVAWKVITSIIVSLGKPKVWTVIFDETADSTEIYLVKGENADFIGRALRSASDYDDKMLELENDATEKANTRNSTDRLIRRL